jgi:WD40 repeat protein
MWKADTGTLMGVFAGHGGAVTCGQFTHDGKQVVTASVDCSVRVWNPKNQTATFVFSGELFHHAPVNALACKEDSNLALTGGEDGACFLININTGKVIGNLVSHTNSVECVGFSKSNPFALTGGLDHSMIVWDLHSGQPRLVCKHDEDEVTKLATHESGPLVATGCTGGTVWLWDERNGNCVRKYSGHEDHILDVCFSRYCYSSPDAASVHLSNTCCIIGMVRPFSLPVMTTLVVYFLSHCENKQLLVNVCKWYNTAFIGSHFMGCGKEWALIHCMICLEASSVFPFLTRCFHHHILSRFGLL